MASSLRLTRTLGSITIRLLDDVMPLTTAHMRAAVTELGSEPGCFYRVQRPEHWVPGREFQVVQEAAYQTRVGEVAHKVGPLTHRRGSVSLGRRAPGTACAEFFICLDERAPALDRGAGAPMDGHGFAVFREVFEGMELVERIHRMPTKPDEPDGPLRGQLLQDMVAFTATVG